MICDIFRLLLIATTFVNSLQKENVLERKLKPRVSGNEIFDTIIRNIISDGIVKKKFTAVPIRNLEADLETKLFVVQVRASLVATGGVISGLTSLHRISDVTHRTVGNTTYFTAGVTLYNLQLTFNHYHLRFGVFFKNGNRLTLNVSIFRVWYLFSLLCMSPCTNVTEWNSEFVHNEQICYDNSLWSVQGSNLGRSALHMHGYDAPTN